MADRAVKAAFVRWRTSSGGRRIAFQGEVIPSGQLPEAFEAKLDGQGALHPVGHAELSAAADVDLDTGTVEDAAAWLRGERGDKPKASEVVAAAGDDVDRAQLLLDAEKSLSGDPRKSVVDGLRKIIDG